MECVLPIALLVLLGRLNAQALVFEEFRYTVTNNSITITYVDCLKVKSVLAIPAVIAGLPVTTIAARGPRHLEGVGGISGFLSCSSVTRVTIPGSVTNIGVGAFASSQGLTAINVDASNPAYSSLDGVLFNKDRSTLVQYPTGRLGEYTLPDTVDIVGASAFEGASGLTGVTLPDRLTTLGDGAFYGCSNLLGVTIGDNVTSIGNEAFSFCRLTSVHLPQGVAHLGDGAFYWCTALTDISVAAANSTYSSLEGVLFNKEQSILLQYALGRTDDYTIPDSVTALGDGAFHSSRMTGVTIPGSFTTIPSNAFSYCYQLATVSIPNSVTTIGKQAFHPGGLTSVSLPDSVTSIGDQAFKSCQLTDVSIPSSVTTIGDEAFNDCIYLTNVTISRSVTTIAARAFGGCFRLKAIDVDPSNPAYSSLEGVLFNKERSTLIQHPIARSGAYTLPDSVTAIGDEAFANCTRLTSVTLPGGVTSIGAWAFSSCEGLRSLALPDSVTTLGQGALNGCSSLSHLPIPDRVTSIGAFAFSGCGRLTQLMIPDSVTSLGDGAFGGCSSLTGITLPNSITTLGDFMFNECSSLTSVMIPDRVTSLGRNAFSGCSRLSSVTLPGSITRIGDFAFNWGTARLTGVYFRGNAPGAGPESQIFHDRTKVYYLPGTAGWGATFAGASTIPWFLPNPLILAPSPGSGLRNNPFQFTISWATNATIVVEASAGLAHPVWSPVGTNTLIGGSAHFSDPQAVDAPARFYRLRGE